VFGFQFLVLTAEEESLEGRVLGSIATTVDWGPTGNMKIHKDPQANLLRFTVSRRKMLRRYVAFRFAFSELNTYN